MARRRGDRAVRVRPGRGARRGGPASGREVATGPGDGSRPPRSRSSSPASRSTGRPARSPRAGRRTITHACLRARRADRADDEGRVDPAAADRAAEVVVGKPLLHRPNLELALAHVLEVLRRPEEHVDERAEERREQAEQGCHRHEPRVVDPAAGVLERPSTRSRARRRRRGTRPTLRATSRLPASGEGGGEDCGTGVREGACRGYTRRRTPDPMIAARMSERERPAR